MFVKSSATGGLERLWAARAWQARLEGARVATEPAAAGNQAGAANPELLDSLLRDLNHRVWEVRRNACEELAALADQRAVPHLIGLLEDHVGAVRFAAAEALGRLGDRSAIPALIALLDNATFGAYGPVIDALASLRAQQAIPYFIRFLRDPDARVRSLAANALMVMTRQFISFKAKGTQDEREAAIAQWEAWWQKNKDVILRNAAADKR